MKPISTVSKLLLAGLLLWVGPALAQPAIPTMDEEPEFTPGLSNTVSWSDEGASGAVEYFVGASDDSLFPDPQQLDLSSGWITETEYEFDEVLEDGVLYYYRVASRDAGQNMSDWSYSVWSTQDASGPDPVTDLAAVGRFEYIRLNWSDVEDAGIGLDYYRVYRSEAAGELGNRIGAATVAFYADETAQPQVTYWYTVRPVDQFNNETVDGNNQDDAEIQYLDDPVVTTVQPPECYVTEAEAIDVSGIYDNTIAIWVNGTPARMTLDPVAGEFLAEGIPLGPGPNLVIAYGEGSFGRTHSDTAVVVQLLADSGDPVVTITAPEDQSDHYIGTMIDIVGEVENVACLTVMGEPVEIAWSPDYSTGTFTYADFEVTEVGPFTIDAEGLGSPASGETEDRVATDEVTIYGIAGPPPVAVAITSPEDAAIFRDSLITVEGSFSAAWKVEVNGVEAELNVGDLTFSLADVPLVVGPNVITAVAFGADDATAEDMITVYHYPDPDPPDPPAVEITSPSDNDVIDLRSIDVEGTSSYAGYVTVAVDGGEEIMADLDYETGVWSIQVDLPEPSARVELLATAYGADENAEDSVAIFVIADGGAPSIEITFPEDGSTTRFSFTPVRGTAARVGRVLVNGIEAGFDDFLNFDLASFEFLEDGWNTIIAVGYGANDQTVADTVMVYVNTDCDGEPGEIAITVPEDEFRTGADAISVSGTSNCLVSVDVNGAEASFDLDTGVWDLASVALEMNENTITATGTNYDGGTVTASVTVYRLGQPAIAITSPNDGQVFEFEDSLQTVSGTSTGLLSVTVNGVAATLESSDGSWSITNHYLDIIGNNIITAVGDGLTEVTASITVVRDPDLDLLEYHGIITPNGDDHNDEANIPCENPACTGSIFTRDGQEVIELTDPEESRDGNWFLKWDGQDGEGVIVPSGVYIYQVDDDGDKTTGTIVVAR